MLSRWAQCIPNASVRHPQGCAAHEWVLHTGPEVTLETQISRDGFQTWLSVREAVAQHPITQQSFLRMTAAFSAEGQAQKAEKAARVKMPPLSRQLLSRQPIAVHLSVPLCDNCGHAAATHLCTYTLKMRSNMSSACNLSESPADSGSP